MSSDYDKITAEHYFSYRPPLHEIILRKCIEQREKYARGLDIGCGTGHSSIALSKFCKQVVGIDPSHHMLENTLVDSNVEYQNYQGQELEFEGDSFDVITFAGSLHYGKSQELLDEVARVSKTPGLIVVYDFEILLDDLLRQLQFETSGQSTYNHEADFSGLRGDRISTIKKGKEKKQVHVTHGNLAHLLLSVKAQYVFFEKRFGRDDLHRQLSGHLSEISDSKAFKIDTDLYYKTYEVSETRAQTNGKL
ncbi:MAG: class I SAM-dependent methyltransferase [Aurantibacter sp.]